MKHLVRVMGIAVLLSLFGTTAPAYAQEQHQDQAKPKQDKQQKQQQAKPQQHAQPKQQGQGAQQAQRGQQQQQHAQPAQQAQRGQQQQQHAQPTQQAQRGHQQQQNAQPVQQAQQVQPGQRGQQGSSQHGQYASSSRQSGRYDGDRSRRIPDDRFRANFGRDHSFRIDRDYMVAGGYSRFQYGGFWFGMYDPWPADWRYTDDMYVDYVDGGYYLLSPMHPGVQISINVVV